MPDSAIYTIGYGARDMQTFIDALQTNSIQYLIDVRSSPYSSYKPEFSKNALQSTLEANDIHYIFMGNNLGGQPDDQDCYTDGKVDYKKVAQQLFFHEGIERLHQAIQRGHCLALMCSEGKPENCHRSKLIGQVLTAEEIEVLHIDEMDDVISQNDVLLRLTGGQPSLFGDDFFTFTSRKRYRDDEGGKA